MYCIVSFLKSDITTLRSHRLLRVTHFECQHQYLTIDDAAVFRHFLRSLQRWCYVVGWRRANQTGELKDEYDIHWRPECYISYQQMISNLLQKRPPELEVRFDDYSGALYEKALHPELIGIMPP